MHLSVLLISLPLYFLLPDQSRTLPCLAKVLALIFSIGFAPDREQVFLERERHANVRKGDLSYPVRAVRNHDFLYIRNVMPDRWPAGDAASSSISGSMGRCGQLDNKVSDHEYGK